MPGVALDKAHGLVQRNIIGVVKVLENLLVTHGIERGKVPESNQGPCFVYEALVHHKEYAPVYARVQFFARAHKPYLFNLEISLEGPGNGEGGEGFAGAQAHFHCA